MDAYKTQLTSEAKTLLETAIPQRVAQLQALLQAKFASRTPSAVRQTVDATIRSQLPGAIALHSELTATVATVGDHVEQAIVDFQKLSQWILLLIPSIEDGNNFGVQVQIDVLKEIKEITDRLQKIWDSLPDYHSQRATVVEKLNSKPSKETSVTTTTTESHGGKDGDEKKSVVSSVDKTGTTANAAVEDWIANAVAIDVKWYFNLARALESVRDAYAVVHDRVDGNKKKIEFPRGQQRNNYSMY